MPTIFLTGASSGIGFATAEHFLALGWNVVATMRSPEKSELTGPADRLLQLRLDVKDEASIAEARDAALEAFGSVDVLVNNAGYGLMGIFETFTATQIREQLDTNVVGVMNVTRAFLPHFREKASGTIINISSGAGIFTIPLASLYCASKFALEGFTEALAYEMAGIGVAVKLVLPHGAVLSTRFRDATAEVSPAAAKEAPAEYADFLTRVQTIFAAQHGKSTLEASRVAQTIEEAATDGTDRLRYLVGDDTRGFVNARMAMEEEDYIAFMRETFA